MLLANLGVTDLCRQAQDVIALRRFLIITRGGAVVRSGHMSGLGMQSVGSRFGRGARRAGMLAGALCLAMPLVGCLGYDGTISRGYLATNSGVDKVTPGMPAEQVLSTLGTPSTTSTVGGDAWYYISQRVERKFRFMNPSVTDQRVIAVYFGKQKKVERVANYGLEDGQVIDVLSRTTPTAGSEQNFLRQMLTGLLKFS
jgi:outer membrane protein assembly factor BamE (lipoprotein component of BamABCDE complex)